MELTKILYRFSVNFKAITGIIIFLLFVNQVIGQVAAAPYKWGNWEAWGDLGNGKYANPVIPADYSDIDCIRVGDDYYAVSSTFQYSPGFVILHSKDLVNWETLSHAVSNLNEISPEMNWDKMNRYGTGIWAGAIRYYHNKFWIYFGTPDEGYFMTTASNPRGPWQPLTHVLKGKGWDDCCPFLDDDGQLYLIGTNYADNYKIHLFKLTADGRSIIPGYDNIIHQSEGSEANKLYKINGTYYHFFSEVKPEGRAIMMERAQKVNGPYLEEKQLSYAQKQFNEPNQGGLVQTKRGEWYFLTHHGTGDWEGRAVSLLPVNWVDGWPIIGKVSAEKIGEMVWQGKMPVKSRHIKNSTTNDEFNRTVLKQQWEWNYQPRSDKWSLTERPGWLRLKAFKPVENNNLLKAGNTLTQRAFRTQANIVTVKLDISAMASGQHAGLSHFGKPGYAAFGISCKGIVKTLQLNIKEHVFEGPVLHGRQVWLRSVWGQDGKSRFYYSINGKEFYAFGDKYQLAWGAYRGDRIAVYCYNNLKDEGYIDIDFLHYRYR
ncbi:glycoside hydrolase family 43 protein [Mucilaginibacter phyllosphaerae]|uniref:Beta-xylosidase n=1 Tax=Mucilaginibacter phyllosphaerae TaxID=1812349 RepID=A0A4Y8AJP9_9SPHI|nr:glycoside hydrolase 43 family protein [Mucilaginibacter phyllosphaerae]MBB3968248.1 beta-xylosidase [Mucilaginibacter phyllosphaerae]TEW68745.1 glycosyl hydrolase 43 family protein [Mucilaginibacter phyllosphaerae]GGH00232.1 beta-xylosidase [Mucilaginibacter phyllosphaerae]